MIKNHFILILLLLNFELLQSQRLIIVCQNPPCTSRICQCAIINFHAKFSPRIISVCSIISFRNESPCPIILYYVIISSTRIYPCLIILSCSIIRYSRAEYFLIRWTHDNFTPRRRSLIFLPSIISDLPGLVDLWLEVVPIERILLLISGKGILLYA